jgi:hypothetical protein
MVWVYSCFFLPPASREHHPGDQRDDDAGHNPSATAGGQEQAKAAEDTGSRQRQQDATSKLCAQQNQYTITRFHAVHPVQVEGFPIPAATGRPGARTAF